MAILDYLDDALGWAGGAAGGAVAGPGGAVVGGKVGSWLGGLVGGRSCPGAPDPEHIRHMLGRLSASERYELDRLNRAANPGANTSDARQLAKHIGGGDDCVASSAEGRALQDYGMALLAKYPPTYTAQPIPSEPAYTGGIGGGLGPVYETGGGASGGGAAAGGGFSLSPAMMILGAALVVLLARKGG